MAELLHNKMDLVGPWHTMPSISYLLGALIMGLCLAAWRVRQYRYTCATMEEPALSEKKDPVITPLEGFNWENTEPLQFRPFKGKDKFNLTMSIEYLDPSELIPMDKTYQERLNLRKSILNEHHDIVVAVNDRPETQDPRTRAAVSELYTFILGKYLPTRYPDMFKLKTNDSLTTFENLVTGATYPTTLSPSTPTIQALEILTQTVDEEFLILLPELSPENGDQPKYILQAYAACFPSGFNTREKLGLRLADIHKPVPGYKEKIERSMDRFFARIEVGKFVRRVNWSVTIATDLFAAFGGTHAAVGKKEDAIQPGMLNVDETVLRCERQTLHRMPRSEALVFGFHTYTYPMRQIKDEGLGEDMAVAVDGLRKGNVPEMHVYKRGDVWGEALKEFLRS
ncbi:uncharacterized protein N7511_010798 [Penicillium nucicola]|uniref:uncharacterized protein n=1 Tax=Penicillium nucicola TaxID=1850975 RepID=UPI0025457C34|nr:uncharacterized protein N7511_010798 [Penicillium nucicola]KAJ5749102.1 hypothetical protein N7511_010798 [Penicillium nucicola]